jgi:hypothetical protein
MANQNVYQGTVNLLLGSVIFANYPALNITASYLAPGGISLSFDGETSLLLPTMVGAVTSPRPYVFANIDAHILRTQALSNAFKNQIETTTTLGSVKVYTDTTTLLSYQIDNCVLLSTPQMTYDGTSPEFTVRLRGVYEVNVDLFNVS